MRRATYVVIEDESGATWSLWSDGSYSRWVPESAPIE